MSHVQIDCMRDRLNLAPKQQSLSVYILTQFQGLNLFLIGNQLSIHFRYNVVLCIYTNNARETSGLTWTIISFDNSFSKFNRSGFMSYISNLLYWCWFPSGLPWSLQKIKNGSIIQKNQWTDRFRFSYFASKMFFWVNLKHIVKSLLLLTIPYLFLRRIQFIISICTGLLYSKSISVKTTSKLMISVFLCIDSAQR